jgi:hypothetical protein
MTNWELDQLEQKVEAQAGRLAKLEALRRQQSGVMEAGMQHTRRGLKVYRQVPRRIWGDSMEETFHPNFCFGRDAIANQADVLARVEHLLGRPVHDPWI